MPFRLPNPLSKTMPVRLPIVKDMVIKNGRFVKAGQARVKTSTKSASRRVAGQQPSKPSRQHAQVPVTELLQAKRLQTKFAEEGEAMPTCEDEQTPNEDGTKPNLDDGNEFGQCQVALRGLHNVVGTSRSASYIKNMKQMLHSGALDLQNGPWVHPGEQSRNPIIAEAMARSSAEPALDADKVRDIVFRPSVFVWAPHVLFPGMLVK